MKERPFPLKPMSVGNILDYTFRIYRNNFAAIIAISALVGAVFNMLVLVVTELAAPSRYMTDPWSSIIGAARSGDFQHFFENYANRIPEPIGPDYFSRTILMMLLAYGGSFISYALIYPFVQGGITNIASKYFHGTRLNVSHSFSDAWKGFGKLILTALSLMACYVGFGIVYFIIAIVFIPLITIVSIGSASSGGSIAGFIIILIIMLLIIVSIAAAYKTLISFVYPVAVSEGVFHFDAIGRSFKLAGKKFWRILGVNILAYLLVYIITGSLGGLALVVSILSPIDIMFQKVVTQLVNALVMPVLYISSTLLYFDTRIRVEGYDLELMSYELEGNKP